MFRRPPAKEVWEFKAAELVGEVLGCEFQQYDDGSEERMVDFVGQAAIGQVALEVTSAVDAQTLALANDLRPPEGFADHLRYEWRFTMPWGAPRPVKRGFWTDLLREVEGLEEVLGTREVELFGGAIGLEEESASSHSSTIRLLRGMGLIQGSALQAEKGRCGGIYIGFGGFMSPGDPLRAVVVAVGDNHQKLCAAGAAERHLFIWVHDTELAMTSRLILDINPSDAVDLRGIDQVWLAPWQENVGVGMLLARTWTFREGNGWRRTEREVPN